MAHPHFIDATTVDVPAIVIVGENDKNYIASGEYFGEKLPNATKVVVKDAGHPAALEQPERRERGRADVSRRADLQPQIDSIRQDSSVSIVMICVHLWLRRAGPPA